MLRDIVFVARKDLRYAMRLPQVWVWMFVMPLALSYLVGSLMGSLVRHLDRVVLYAPADAGFLADDLVTRLTAIGYRVERVGDRAVLKDNPFWIALPEGFTHSVLAGPPVQIELAYPAGYRFAGYEYYRVGRAVDDMLADLAILSQRGQDANAVQLTALENAPRKLSLRVESAGKPRRLIVGFQQSVPGFIVMFTLQVSLTSGSVLLILERRKGVLRRLAATQVSRASIIAGKLGARLAMGLIQVGVAMLAGRYWFAMDWGQNLWAVLLLLLTYTALCSSLAVAFAGVARTESQALAAGVIVSCVLAAIGGCWWPIEVTPKWMQHAAMFLPTGWAMEGLHRLISYGDSPAAVTWHITALGAATMVVGWIAVRRFRLV
ncbi:MAG TPA: ABC transporter permease [Candidatus Solibacter sp.]|nr:ABC transporter permease [Candidatus Solibacter sp.]